jgi:hypothetical protein
LTAYPRNVHFDEGVAMVVTDLHGDADAYQMLRDTFLMLRERGRVKRIIFCGDLIHGYGSESHDASVDMLLDVMALQQQLGEDAVQLLLGNHEMPHLYGVTLSKGEIEFTSRFERQMRAAGERESIKQFLNRLPFFATTAGGVLLTHAGASPAVMTNEDAERLLTFDHDAVLRLADDRLQAGFDLNKVRQDDSYREQVAYYLGIDRQDDPRYLDLLRGHFISQRDEEFQFLWDVLFATNEQGWSVDAYLYVVQAFLDAIGAHVPVSPQVLVSGHIPTRGGHERIGLQHLRLSSFAHATPRQEGQYLLLDCAKPVRTVDALTAGLRMTFERSQN